MSRQSREPTKNQYSNGLTYVAQKPSFIQNFGKPQPDDPREAVDGPSGRGRGGGREPLPERPREGRWARGSDDEGGDEDEVEDEWEQMYGGDDGPQVVVLKEGRHLTADELKRERRRAAGKRSVSPPVEKPETKKISTIDKITTGRQTALASLSTTSSKKTTPSARPGAVAAKRKLVGAATEINVAEGAEAGDGKDDGAKKKKKKVAKGLLSFNEDDGES